MLNAFKQFGFRHSVAVAITAVGVACSAPGFAQGAAKAAAKGAGAAAPAEIVGNARQERRRIPHASAATAFLNTELHFR